MFGVQDILVVLFVAGALWYVVRFIRRAMSGKGGCHCEQGSPCGGGSEPGVAKRSMRRVPLVTLSPVAEDQAGPAEPPGSSPTPIQTTASPPSGSE